MHYHHKHPENDPQFKSLNVNGGVTDVLVINPYSKKRIKRRRLSAGEYLEGILAGDVSVLSQAVTLVESSLPHDQK